MCISGHNTNMLDLRQIKEKVGLKNIYFFLYVKKTKHYIVKLSEDKLCQVATCATQNR